MTTSQVFKIELPPEMVALIKDKVASGAYASESDVIRDGLQALEDRDAALEEWLTTEVAEAYDEYKADPTTVMPASEVLERIKTNYRPGR
jgi:antitoxin ParD1/3/4